MPIRSDLRTPGRKPFLRDATPGESIPLIRRHSHFSSTRGTNSFSAPALTKALVTNGPCCCGPQRGDRLKPLLFEALLDRCSTPLCAALHQHPTQGDDVLCNPLRRLAQLAPWLRALTGCPAWIVSLVARFPFIEPAFGAVQLAADRLDGVSGQIARDCLVTTVFLRGAHHCLLMPFTWHPARWDLFSMSWHAILRAIPGLPEAPGPPLAQARGLPLPRHAPTDDSD
jgi:hypothetical protein